MLAADPVKMELHLLVILRGNSERTRKLRKVAYPDDTDGGFRFSMIYLSCKFSRLPIKQLCSSNLSHGDALELVSLLSPFSAEALVNVSTEQRIVKKATDSPTDSEGVEDEAPLICYSSH